MAQTPRYPKNIFFFCRSASQYGGETPLCRSDYLYAELLKVDANLISKFEKNGVIYNSVMSNEDELFSGQGRSWQKTLGVSFKEEAELKLKELGYSWHWLEEDNLSVTTKTLKAIKELKNGKKSFFNQVLAASLGWKKNSNKIAEIIILPPIAIGKIAAKTVIIGSNEFRKACFRITFFSDSPLALAVLI